MRLHALVADAAAAEAAVAGGATVVQLRIKGASPIEPGRAVAALCRRAGVELCVNDDVEAAIALGADWVHLGQGDPGRGRARSAGLGLGLSAASVEQARAAEEAGAGYVGAGAVWATPTKPESRPIGLHGLAAICAAVSIPVVAIGGIDASNAADCIRAGAAGVAVVRAAADARAVREAVDAAL